MKEVFKKYWGWILVLIIFLFTNESFERTFKLQKWQKEFRKKNLESIEKIIDKCKRLNTRYSWSNEFDGWHESLDYWGTGFFQLFSMEVSPIVTIRFEDEEGDLNTYCKVEIGYEKPLFTFYHDDWFHLGLDRYEYLPHELCSDRAADEHQC